MKALDSDNKFTVVSQNRLYLLDENRQILGQVPVEYPHKIGLRISGFCSDDTCTWYPLMYQAIMYNGGVYV